MVLLYSHTTTARLQYICNFIFKQLLQVEFSITIDSEEFKNHTGICINYSNSPIKKEELRIGNVNLLFEETISPQQIQCFTYNNYKAFFKVDNSDIAFDIFAASFYLLSRYEEYLPHNKDMYGRYNHEDSLAFKENFLHLPLINIWVKHFAESIKNKYSTFNIQHSIFNFVPTYDIDIAYSYKHKGVVRNVGGFIKKPSLERIKVLLGLRKDPFNSYDWMNALHDKYNLLATYFFLLAEKTSKYDKNIALHKNALWRLIKLHAKKYSIGIHPSWQSANNTTILKKEKSYLEAMSELTIINSRQHFIKFNLPQSYRQLLDAGITNEYSMGYGSINGFRASVATSFNWFDVENNEETNLRIHPFCFMDANCYYEQKQTPQQSFEELMQYYKVCREVGGTLITIFHNNFLGTDKNFKGWATMYEAFIKEVHKGFKDE
ncbi:MAG: polysaccharide deacetylase family protein [Ferruginibacter sp.]|nr:polysaccharide deacetylase family protein [Ferruginibacter sp.]